MWRNNPIDGIYAYNDGSKKHGLQLSIVFEGGAHLHYHGYRWRFSNKRLTWLSKLMWWKKLEQSHALRGTTIVSIKEDLAHGCFVLLSNQVILRIHSTIASGMGNWDTVYEFVNGSSTATYCVEVVQMMNNEDSVEVAVFRC